MLIPNRTGVMQLPKDNNGSSDAIIRNMNALEDYLVRFKAAIELFEHADALIKNDRSLWNSSVGKWLFIACRDGAMTVFHFEMARRAINDLSNGTPFVRDHLDWIAWKEGRTAFDTAFPTFSDIRHAVAHHADLSKTPEQLDKNMSRDLRNHPAFDVPEHFSMFLAENLNGRTFLSSYRGRTVSYDLSVASFDVLHAILLACDRAFAPVIVATTALFQESLRSEQHAS